MVFFIGKVAYQQSRISVSRYNQVIDYFSISSPMLRCEF